MNVNLAVRNLQNYCNYNRILKPLQLNNVSNISKCRCSILANSSSFTNNNQNGMSQKRFFSDDKIKPPSKFPQLMPETPIFVWPSLFKTIRNFILATFIIKPYFDKDFNLKDFVDASKKAVEVVSRKLSEGDLKSLEGLVTSDLIPTLQKTISLMSLAQREEIAVNVDDIYFSFPYEVGIMFSDEENSKRFVEITMVYHSLKGLASMRSRGEEPPLNMGLFPEYQRRICISNYRFTREFTKGVDGDWTVNLLNHVKPGDEES
ncbi:m-AAA protease-interacting protein 1, mitochondrial [Leptinotarsa decemlineata]|uniref:m-AAA protease-interacting protein 1, mitochondrial n=1 Tax=Leptinotarsa decemlineata TaxID=7539 RepID=UPI000C251B74|nr:m-AAA protease-interacting protein 1, mitochondrial [Leptinotarsa decemlineata]